MINFVPHLCKYFWDIVFVTISWDVETQHAEFIFPLHVLAYKNYHKVYFFGILLLLYDGRLLDEFNVQ
jgi:hypothetical protein